GVAPPGRGRIACLAYRQQAHRASRKRGNDLCGSQPGHCDEDTADDHDCPRTIRPRCADGSLICRSVRPGLWTGQHLFHRCHACPPILRAPRTRGRPLLLPPRYYSVKICAYPLFCLLIRVTESNVLVSPSSGQSPRLATPLRDTSGPRRITLGLPSPAEMPLTPPIPHTSM